MDVNEGLPMDPPTDEKCVIYSAAGAAAANHGLEDVNFSAPTGHSTPHQSLEYNYDPNSKLHSFTLNTAGRSLSTLSGLFLFGTFLQKLRLLKFQQTRFFARLDF